MRNSRTRLKFRIEQCNRKHCVESRRSHETLISLGSVQTIVIAEKSRAFPPPPPRFLTERDIFGRSVQARQIARMNPSSSLNVPFLNFRTILWLSAKRILPAFTAHVVTWRIVARLLPDRKTSPLHPKVYTFRKVPDSVATSCGDVLVQTRVNLVSESNRRTLRRRNGRERDALRRVIDTEESLSPGHIL